MRASFRWLLQWLRDAAAAATRPSFWRRAGERPPSAAFAHLAMLTLLFWVLPVCVLFFGGARQFLASLDATLDTRVPAGATFELRDGKFLTNLDRPLVIRDEGFTFIVNSASSSLDLSATETGVMIGRDAIVRQDGASRQITGFASAQSFRFTREELRDGLARWAPLGLFAIALVLLVLVFALWMAGALLSVLLHGFVLWLALRLWKRPWDWRRAFSSAAYAATGPFVLRAFLTGAGLGVISGLWYWLLIGWIAFDAIRKSDPAAAPPPPKPQTP